MRSNKLKRSRVKKTKKVGKSRVKRSRVKRTKSEKKKQPKRKKSKRIKRNLKGGSTSDYFSGRNVNKKIRINSCIGQGTQRNSDTTKQRAKDAAQGIPCETLGELYENNLGKNTKDCWNDGSDKSSFLDELTEGRC